MRLPLGEPVAFIETAWRKYTRHSKNKVQEIRGAIEPLAERYEESVCFVGAILAGEFTVPAIYQLTSRGIRVLHLPVELVLQAFDAVGIDASSDDDTPEEVYMPKIEACRAMSDSDRERFAEALFEGSSHAVEQFTHSLEESLDRQVEIVRILPLHGTPSELTSIEDAIAYIENYDEAHQTQHHAIVRYEIEIRYLNGDKMEGQFREKDQAINMLRKFLTLTTTRDNRHATS